MILPSFITIISDVLIILYIDNVHKNHSGTSIFEINLAVEIKKKHY